MWPPVSLVFSHLKMRFAGAARGRLMHFAPRRKMVSASTDETTVLNAIANDPFVSIAAVNAPKVLSFQERGCS